MTTFIISFLIALLTIIISGRIIENGDMNAAGMYLIVFSIPALVLTGFNALIVRFSIKRLITKNQKIRLIIFPVLLTGIASLGGSQFNSGQFGFVASFSFVSISVVNIYWVIRLISK